MAAKASTSRAAAAPKTSTKAGQSDDALPIPSQRIINGQTVVSDEVEQSGLSTEARPVPIHGRRVLTLQDGTKVFACADCPEVVGTRGEVMKHRWDKHSMAKPGGKARATVAALPTSVLGAALGDVLMAAAHLDAIEEQLVEVEKDRDEWRARCLAVERRQAAVERQLAKVGFVLAKVEDE